MDYIVHGVAKSQTQLSHFHFPSLGRVIPDDIFLINWICLGPYQHQLLLIIIFPWAIKLHQTPKTLPSLLPLRVAPSPESNCCQVSIFLLFHRNGNFSQTCGPPRINTAFSLAARWSRETTFWSRKCKHEFMQHIPGTFLKQELASLFSHLHLLLPGGWNENLMSEIIATHFITIRWPWQWRLQNNLGTQILGIQRAEPMFQL